MVRTAMLRSSTLVCLAAMLLISCGASPTLTAPSRSTSPSPPTSPATLLPMTTTPSPDFMGIPERLPTTPFPTIALPVQPAANFAFSFGYGACRISRVLNTFDNTLAQYSINSPPITTTFILTADERTAIYQHMRAINLFGYPTTYTIPVPDTDLRIISAPHPRYEFTLRNESIQKTLTWEDEISRPTSAEADNLRGLIAFLKLTIERHSEVQRLPQLVEACA